MEITKSIADGSSEILLCKHEPASKSVRQSASHRVINQPVVFLKQTTTQHVCTLNPKWQCVCVCVCVCVDSLRLHTYPVSIDGSKAAFRFNPVLSVCNKRCPTPFLSPRADPAAVALGSSTPGPTSNRAPEEVAAGAAADRTALWRPRRSARAFVVAAALACAGNAPLPSAVRRTTLASPPHMSRSCANSSGTLQLPVLSSTSRTRRVALLSSPFRACPPLCTPLFHLTCPPPMSLTALTRSASAIAAGLRLSTRRASRGVPLF
jgi:hypothetical protein